jgi:vacuolar-type H+-ATPase subunit H
VKRHIANTQEKLGDLAGLADKTERTERRILEQAEKRLTEVQTAIDRARTGIEAAPDDAQQRYQQLIVERGQLQMVIAQAKKALAPQ